MLGAWVRAVRWPRGFLDTDPEPTPNPATTATVAVGDRLDAPASPPAEAPEAGLGRGESVGRYVIMDEIGAGGMGVVYRAYDPDLHRRVAIKLLRSGTGTFGSARMLREAQAMAQLGHPNVVAIHDVGTVGQHVYIAMEYVDGRTLTRWQEKKRPWPEVLEAYTQAGRGLMAAHAQELVHRDFKPDNVMIDDARRVRVMDFGLARVWGVRGPEHTPGLVEDDGFTIPEDTPLNSQLTRDGAVMGTPSYMAPEQFAGQPSDERTDQFSFCIALWEALHGARPFAGDHITDLCLAVTEGRVRDPAPSELPSGIDKALRRGLCPDPNDRWPTLEDLLAELGRHLDPPRRRGGPVFALLSVGVLAGAGALSVQPDERCTGAAEALDGVWSDARAATIGAKFTELGGEAGTHIWEDQRAQLNAWTDQWIGAHEDACQASTVRGEQSAGMMELRMGCLGKARIDLDATLQVLGDADEQTMQRAGDVVQGLPPIARCANVERLDAGVEEPPSDIAEAVAATRRQVARSYALLRAAHYEEAIVVGRQGEAAGIEAGFEPVAVDALLAISGGQSALSDADAAIVSVKRAQRMAARNGQWDAAVIAASRLVYLLARDKAKPAEALAVAELALGLAEYARDDDALARLHSAFASTLSALGRYDEAEASYTRTYQLWSDLDGVRDEMLATALLNRAVVRQLAGRLPEALEDQREALELYTRALGPEHPDVATAHHNLAAVFNTMGRADEAETHYRRGLEIRLATLRPTHPDVMASQGGIAIVLATAGQLEPAQALFEEVTRGLAAELGPKHPQTMVARGNIAEVLLMRRDFAQAEAVARRTLRDVQDTLGDAHPQVANVAGLVAKALAAQGEHARAVEFARLSLTALEASVGAGHVDAVRSRVALALALVELGQLDDAEGEVRRALSVGLQSNVPTHPVIAEARAALGEVLLRTKRTDAARTELETAWSVLKESEPEARATVAFALARALWSDPAEQGRARALASSALELTIAEDSPERRTIAAWVDARPASAPDARE